MSHPTPATTQPHVSLEYGHWGITVSTRHSPRDYAPASFKTFYYPVSTRGPINSATTEREAMEYARSLGGQPKGPFFHAA